MKTFDSNVKVIHKVENDGFVAMVLSYCECFNFYFCVKNDETFSSHILNDDLSVACSLPTCISEAIAYNGDKRAFEIAIDIQEFAQKQKEEV